MKHLFLDTNILIDFLTNREPFATEAARLFDYGLKKKAVLYVAAVSYNNIYYLLRQRKPHAATINILEELQALSVTIDVSAEVIQQSLKADFTDFEDAIQYHCARTISKLDGLVTRDRKGFKNSSLPVLTPLEALALIQSTHP